jgi:hypothetical protein
MRKFHSFFALPATNRRLLLRTLLLVIAVRLGLTLLSYRTLRGLIPRVFPCVNSGASNAISEARMARLMWAVRVTSRYVPAASCLTQAITAQILLALHGEKSRLHIGVAKSEEGVFQAHAWVESQDLIVIGGASSSVDYTPIAAFEGFV